MIAPSGPFEEVSAWTVVPWDGGLVWEVFKELPKFDFQLFQGG